VVLVEGWSLKQNPVTLKKAGLKISGLISEMVFISSGLNSRTLLYIIRSNFHCSSCWFC